VNQSVDHRFLVLNQTDKLRFNRAALINVGWYEADRLGCDYLVMHDVDIIPLNPVLNYRYPGRGTVRHISAGQYHPIKRYNYKKFIGGVLMLTMSDYKMLNGMSNKYWGWGLEDDEFYLRMKLVFSNYSLNSFSREANLTDHIERPTNLTTDRNTTFQHIHGPERKRDYAMIGNQKAMSRKRDRISGLHSVQYVIEGRELLQFENGSDALSIHIGLKCDRKWTNYCEFAQP
jgi:xylosylprotein 4-beta-galactosyltransferase